MSGPGGFTVKGQDQNKRKDIGVTRFDIVSTYADAEHLEYWCGFEELN